MTFIKNITNELTDDAELLQQYQQNGDKKALAILFQRHMDLIYGVCLKYLKDHENARDAVMNIYEAITIKVNQYPITHFKSWLYVLSKNHCLMQLRSAKNIKMVPADENHMQLEQEMHLNDVWERETQLNQLEDCLQTLSNEQQQTVKLFYLENNCYKEIAVKTGLDWNKVRSLIQNGRRNLKICMETKTIEIEK